MEGERVELSASIHFFKKHQRNGHIMIQAVVSIRKLVQKRNPNPAPGTIIFRHKGFDDLHIKKQDLG